MARLRLQDVTAGYDGADVLRSVSLDVPTGELLCVLGPSGGGKSTLLRVIAGLEPTRAGSVLLDDVDLGGVPPHERGIGLMFQDYALFPHRHIGDNVGFGLRMQGRSAAATRTRVGELLELVGLAGMERRSVGQLSGGEQQRVALARALAPEPRVLLLDEPMGSLDRSLRERLPDELRAIFASLELTVVYVTHDQDEALTVADQVALLDEGKVVAEGRPEALWTRPPSAWAARFLGARNVAEAAIENDVLQTPWGMLAVADLQLTHDGKPAVTTGAVTVVMRPSAFSLDAGGPIRGRVSARRFAGDHVLLTLVAIGTGVAIDAEPLTVEVRGGAIPAVGADVGVRPLPGSTHIIAAPEPLPLEP